MSEITTPGEAFAFIARVYVYVYANARTMIRLARSNAESAARCESYMQALNILHHAGSALIEESESSPSGRDVVVVEAVLSNLKESKD